MKLRNLLGALGLSLLSAVSVSTGALVSEKDTQSEVKVDSVENQPSKALPNRDEDYIYFSLIGVESSVRVYITNGNGTEYTGSYPGKALTNTFFTKENYYTESNNKIRYLNTESNIWAIDFSTSSWNWEESHSIIISFVDGNNNVTKQSPEMPFDIGALYVYQNNTFSYLIEAGAYVGNFLYTCWILLEYTAVNQSFCKVSKSNAQAALVDGYECLSLEAREEHVHNSTIYTWDPNGSGTKTWVTYKEVVKTLSKIAGYSYPGLSAGASETLESYNVDVSTKIIIIVSTISIAGFITLLVIKKRSHN